MDKSRIKPIRTAEELDAALAAGAKVQYTACGDAYDAPTGGWIDAFGNNEDLKRRDRERFVQGSPLGLFRAIYPAAPAKRPSFFRRLFGRKAAA